MTGSLSSTWRSARTPESIWATSASGHGHATAASRALTEVALTLPGIERVEIHCDQANLRSQRVPERLGYRLDRIDPVPVAAPAETGHCMIWIYPDHD
jgi:RimJ/RimL family protein N-acetyltransferase